MASPLLDDPIYIMRRARNGRGTDVFLERPISISGEGEKRGGADGPY
jgi:hypothetical protein